MWTDQTLIDRIVSQVLQQLQPAGQARADDAPSDQRAAGLDPAVRQVERDGWLVLNETVITGDLLEERLNGAKRLRIGERSILTPSARDVLRNRNVEWSRNGSATMNPPQAAVRWKIIVQTVTPLVQSLLEGWPRWAPHHWSRDLVGRPDEAVELATGVLCKAEADGVAVLSERAERIACQANRNERVRAACLADINSFDRLREQLGVNLVCINPTGKTFVELRNLLRRCTTAAKPQPPHDWT